jgi:hypothetical protein
MLAAKSLRLHLVSEQLDVGSDGLAAVLGHGTAPAGRETISRLSGPGEPTLQLAVGDEAGLPATDGQGTAPGGSDTMSLPPGPLWIRSFPQIAPGVAGFFPGTTWHVEDGVPVPAFGPRADASTKAIAEAANTRVAAAAKRIAN